jgi:hypothetical protein
MVVGPSSLEKSKAPSITGLLDQTRFWLSADVGTKFKQLNHKAVQFH